MAYDERFADRIRSALGRRKGLTEKRMFGGIGFLINGNMCCGILKSALVVRIAPEETQRTLAQAHTRPFGMARGGMKGCVLVDTAGVKTAAQLKKWVESAAKYAATLPAK